MAGEDAPEKDQRTEEASPHKLEKMREEGQAPRSADVGAAVALLTGLGGIALLGQHTASTTTALAQVCFSLRDADAPLRPVGALVEAVATTAVPLGLMIAVATVVAGLAQTRGLVAFSQVAPKLDRLDPIEGLKKVLPGPAVLLELGKTLLKVVAIGLVAWRVLAAAGPQLLLLARSPAEVGLAEAREVAARLALESCAAFALIAALDFFLAWRRFHEEARMTKQELKDEHKEQEGDPAIKAKRRARARALARQRTIAEVKNATVLVVNPTHLAIALRYDPARDAAPMVLAKGQNELALRMRAEARRAKVPIVENRPLARAMHASAKVGRPIPVELYEAVAQVVAHVFRIRARG